MAESLAHRTWPLYVVPDVASETQLLIGRVVYDGEWRLESNDISTVEGLPHGPELGTMAEIWFKELSREIQAANDVTYNAEPLSISRMEWRQVFHNNHLRIGPAQPLPTAHTA